MVTKLEAEGMEDHPRLRGEHILFDYLSFYDRGSPPPTRGTRTVKKIRYYIGGITPAYAGNTVIRSLKHAMSDYINP